MSLNEGNIQVAREAEAILVTVEEIKGEKNKHYIRKQTIVIVEGMFSN